MSGPQDALGCTAVGVEVPARPYEVLIGKGLLARSGELVRSATNCERLVLVSDETVSGIHGPIVRASLEAAGFVVSEITVPPGETSKNWGLAGQILERFAAVGLDRKDAVAALGGGVVGDLAGFAAATYMRGIDFVQIPTTLLAQVDSSVGGKTGVDLAAGKNLAGAFKQPVLVLADTDTLATLPACEWHSGLAEVAKGAMLDGDEFLGWLEASAAALSAGAHDEAIDAVLVEAVRASVAFKARIVAADEHERDVRECLNYGHTLGHALEKVAGYGTVSHGIAVAEGIRFAAELAVEVLGASAEFAARQSALLDALGIGRVAGRYGVDQLRAAMASDKKARGGMPRFVLLSAPGEWSALNVPEDVLERHLAVFVKEVEAGVSR